MAFGRMIVKWAAELFSASATHVLAGKTLTELSLAQASVGSNPAGKKSNDDHVY